ncbi:solute carrier family 13 member 5-like protein, partial [Leptotrombidium deliense]
EDWRIQHIGAPRELITEKYRQLGPPTDNLFSNNAHSFHEMSVLILFSSLVLLWMFRDPHFFKGWMHFFDEIKPKDATAAIFIVILLFVIPSQPRGLQPRVGLLDWNCVQRKLPWGIVLLRGGGFSMALAVTTSGLSELIGTQLSHLSFISLFGIIIVFSVLTAVCTEFASNSATATVLLPIAAQLASHLQVNLLLLLIPITLCSSFAFVLPVGTPANALVFEHAKLKATDMIIPGLITKLICVVVMLLNLYTFGSYLFDLHSSPNI